MIDTYNTSLSLKGGISQERAKNVFDRVIRYGNSLIGTNDRISLSQWVLNTNQEFGQIFENTSEYIAAIGDILDATPKGLELTKYSSTFYNEINKASTDGAINRVLDIITDMKTKILKPTNTVSPSSSEPTVAPKVKEEKANKKVFIVHGHDNEMKSEVARLVEKLDLEAIILHEQANQGKTIIEKFEKHSDVSYAIVLLSPDDVGKAKVNQGQLNQRARQNVVFELGFFMGKLGRDKVCAIMKDSVEKPSDVDGVVYIPYSGSWRYDVAKEIKEAGITIDMNKLL